MTKISVTGPKKYLKDVIDELHSLKILDIESYDGDLETGEPFEEAEDLSQLLVDIRSLESKLPELEEVEEEELDLEEIEENIPEISSKIDRLTSKKERLKRKISGLNDEKKFFKRITGTGLTYDDLQGSERLEVFIGDLDAEALKEKSSGNYELLEGRSTNVVIYEKDSGMKQVLMDVQERSYELPEGDFSGTPEDIVNNTEARKEEFKNEIETVEAQLEELAAEWRGKLETANEYLTERIEKAEVPLQFGTTENTFIIEGWIPSDSYTQFEEEVAEVTEGKVHIQKEEGENPPVQHDNNRFVQPFESLTDLMAVPKHNELDPSIVLMLTFPLFFGFMIGDAGYGLTSLAVFYGGMKVFPKASDMFKSLMYASVATFLFGLAFGDAFGYVIFGHHSELAAVTGIHLFEQIPILWHRAEHLGQVFTISAIIGLVHVNLGYLIGVYNETIRHDFKHAFLEKGSWLMLEAGALLWYFQGATVGAPVTLIALATLWTGEGVEGIVEIPSLLSNILSYLRIFGVSVAAVSLAAVVNSMANPLLTSGSVIGLAAGIGLLIFGHVFNTFIKIMEGFLQGIRLHYVEMFGKFYEGGGKKYAPFGAKEP
ncbi:V-type ATP synthase subunit I [Candidatus Nanohalovita haloferacivicina]|uniref:V-type ATP synthase subunit I n=1 Tax=Candidatus Nanohalovita haloferacivicina TaxID=2978046 RepID=UPI00325FCB22